MKVSVVYYSRTGNTRKVAEAMAAAAGCEARSLDGIRAPVEADALLIGCAIYAGRVPPEVSRFIEGLDPGKIARAAVFCTSVKGEKANDIMRGLLAERGIAVEDAGFSCRGKFMWKNAGCPSADDLESAKEFAAKFR